MTPPRGYVTADTTLPSPTVSSLPPADAVLLWLAPRLTPRRLDHSIGVAETAVQLLPVFQLPDSLVSQAYMAGLLHDNAKQLPAPLMREKLLAYAVAERERAVPSVWHAWIGAEEARVVWGIEAADVLNAIRYHTTGRVGMTPLEQLLYIADKIESRTRDPVRVAQWRQAVEALPENQPLMQRWLWVLVRATLTYLKEAAGETAVIHPDTTALADELARTFTVPNPEVIPLDIT